MTVPKTHLGASAVTRGGGDQAGGRRKPMGPMGSVPPPWLPLGFLISAAIGLAGLGTALMVNSSSVAGSPFLPKTLGTAHLAMLAFLTIAVLGALHQFSPVVGQRPLRSTAAGWVVMVGIVVTAWLLPFGFIFGPEWVIAVAAVVGTGTVLVAAWNLSGPLMSRSGGVPVVGLRLSVMFLVITVLFGAVYAFDRQAGWFPLLPNRVLAHAHLGLIGWLGLTYVAVAEKLWPMFLLSHRPSARSGVVAVTAIAVGVVPVTVGLLMGWQLVGWVGGVIVVIGLVAHLTSLGSSIKHRKRKLELLHGFLGVSSAFLVLAIVFAVVTQIGAIDQNTRIRLVSAEVVAVAAWLAMAILGHVHKIVPFIGYSMLRSAGVTQHVSGRPLLFADLYSKTGAWIVLAVGTVSLVSIIGGVLFDAAIPVGVGGVGLAVAALVVMANLGLGIHAANAGGGPSTQSVQAPVASTQGGRTA